MRAFQPHAIYRFFTSPTVGKPNCYLTVNSDGRVVGAALDDPIGIQKWRVTKRSSGTFDIVNVATERSLRIRPLNDAQPLALSVDENAETTDWSLEFNSIGSVTFKPVRYQHHFLAFSMDPSNELVVAHYTQKTRTWFWELLPIGPLNWVHAINGEIPIGAVQGGYESDGRPLYVARGMNPQDRNSCVPGKAGSHLAAADVGGCIVGSNRLEHKLSNYAVLVGDPDTYAWVPFNPDDGDTTSTLFRGKRLAFFEVGSENYEKVYSVRCKVGDALICGKGRRATDSYRRSKLAIFYTANGAECTWEGKAYEAEILCTL